MDAVLERDEAEGELHRALAEAREGSGGVALISGEAGIGKTTLVRVFLERAAGRPSVLFGACDPTASPRPFGPLIDAATAVDPQLASRLASGLSRAETFGAALDLVDSDAPTVFVLEDLHWADEATLDLLTFLGRRLVDRRVLLVATYRSDEVDAGHPLRIRIGDIHAGVKTRVQLEPLSASAVASLAGPSRLDPTTIHRITKGNPFFVTEILATGTATPGEVPTTIRDAVMSRASRLSPAARHVLDSASIAPGSIDPWLLALIVGDDASTGLDQCIERGLLRLRLRGDIEFRHDLARLAVEASVPVTRRRHLHARALQALERTGGVPDLSRLAHHAVRAGDGAAVLEYAPAAAAELRAAGNGSDAAELLEAALLHRDLLDDQRAAELLLELARSLTQSAAADDALTRFDEATAAFERAGDHLGHAEALAASGGALWALARQPEYVRRLQRADAVLGPEPTPTRAAAYVAACWCAAHMLAREPTEAERLGQRAMLLANETGNQAIYAETAILSGISRCMTGDEAGLERVRHGMRVAEELGDEELVSLGFSQIGSGFGELRRYEIAMQALRKGIDYAQEREMSARSLYDHAWLARCELETGDWDAASRRASRLIGDPRCTGNTRLVVLCTLGWLRSRRGDPGVRPLLDEALELARTSEHIQRLWPAIACRAEHAWLHGSLEDELETISEGLALARRVDYSPAVEELSHWRWLTDKAPSPDAEPATTPFGASAANRWDLARDRWDAIGCPYEAAFCRYMMGGRDDLTAAYRSFENLGATLMRERTAARLRELGAPVPRGANRSTQTNPHGLTAREVEVALLLPEGCTNAEIARRLHISPKTAGHHVSKILAKLEVTSRAEAAVLVDRLDLDDRKK